jgi:hypothetical protein
MTHLIFKKDNAKSVMKKDKMKKKKSSSELNR